MKKRKSLRQVAVAADDPPPIIIDNGGSGRISQNSVTHDGLKIPNVHQDLVTGDFTGGRIDYDNAAPVAIPDTATKIEITFSGGVANKVTVQFDNGLNSWTIKVLPAAVTVADLGLFGQHLYEFDSGTAVSIDDVKWGGGGSHATKPAGVNYTKVTLNFA